MKRRVLIGIGVVILLVGLFSFFYERISEVQVTYLVPEGHEGCVSIHFNQEGRKALGIVDDEMIIEIPESGGLATSSSADIIIDLGWHPEKAYFIDDKGERIEEIGHEKISDAVMSDAGSANNERYSLSFDGKTDVCY